MSFFSWFKSKPKPVAVKPVYNIYPVTPEHLRFGFTLNGIETGESIPAGTNPIQAAQERSDREGLKYGAKRI